jgi:ABC-type dipeptide/oligopeptide/nickel transport system permease subunit
MKGEKLAARPDLLWLLVWLAGMGVLLLWDLAFLNNPALKRLLNALLNTLTAGLTVVVLALLLGWACGAGLYLLERRGRKGVYLTVSFLLNIVRSVPQIVGILAGYIVLTLLIEREVLVGPAALLFWMSAIVALFVFLDIADLVRGRIAQFAALDFYPAMLCCGVSEARIVNVEILWKNSRAHLLHAMIAVFGMAVFLQCSIDFILSVGLSTEVSATNFPVTLGGLLATMDSKQDILAVGTILTNPAYTGQLFFRHLQGLSVAFALIFTLLCIHTITAGFVRRRRL